MKRIKVALIAMLGVIMTACCIALAACGGGTSYTLTWNTSDPNVTSVVVTGHDKLPESVGEDYELIFKVTVKEGYEANVTPSAIREQSDGSYKVIVKKNLDIKVTATKIVSSITAEFDYGEDEALTYYAGQTISEEHVKVTAHYAAGTPAAEDKVQTSYTISYQNGNALAIGDTKVTISALGKSCDLAVTSPNKDKIVGAVIINLNGGVVTVPEAWESYPDYNYDTEKAVIIWTFTEPIAEDITLPSNPTRSVNGVDFPFLGWSGAKDGVIAAGAETSVIVSARWDVKLVEINSVQLTTKTGTPYFVIEGTFAAADKAYLFLYEGNAKVELKGTEITKDPTDPSFTLEFDLNGLIAKNYQGKWMDIKFRASLGEDAEDEETQQIDLTQYTDKPDFVNLDDILTAQGDDGKWYQFSYRVYTPDGSTEKELKLVYNAAPDMLVTELKLVHEMVGTVDTPYLVIKGDVLKGTTEAEAKAALDKIGVDIQRSDIGGIGWDVEVKGDAAVRSIETVGKKFVGTIKLPLDGIDVRMQCFMHFGGSDFQAPTCMTAGNITIGTNIYRLDKFGADADWLQGLVRITVIDTTAEYKGLTSVGLEEDGGKAYFVWTVTYFKSDEEKLLLWAKGNPNADPAVAGVFVNIQDLGKYSVTLKDVVEKVVITKAATATEDGLCKIYIDISTLEASTTNPYFCHWNVDKNLSVANSANEAERTITVGTKTYKLEKYKDETHKILNQTWADGCNVIWITDSAPAETPSENPQA